MCDDACNCLGFRVQDLSVRVLQDITVLLHSPAFPSILYYFRT